MLYLLHSTYMTIDYLALNLNVKPPSCNPLTLVSCIKIIICLQWFVNKNPEKPFNVLLSRFFWVCSYSATHNRSALSGMWEVNFKDDYEGRRCLLIASVIFRFQLLIFHKFELVYVTSTKVCKKGATSVDHDGAGPV